MSGLAWFRITALARKDAVELARTPGAIFPPLLMMLVALFVPFLVIILTPHLIGRTLEEGGDFTALASNAAAAIPSLARLSGEALIQAYLFHQFAVLLLLVPIVGAMALATHAVVAEKQARALEPILATPISTTELLIAKTMTPFLFALGLSWIAMALYLTGAAAFGDPGVFGAVAGMRMFLMFVVLGPLLELASLLLSVIVSSRATDPRSAQQVTALLILPVTAVFVAQLMGVFVVTLPVLFAASLACAAVNAALLWVGVKVFERESILTRWR